MALLVYCSIADHGPVSSALIAWSFADHRPALLCGHLIGVAIRISYGVCVILNMSDENEWVIWQIRSVIINRWRKNVFQQPNMIHFNVYKSQWLDETKRRFSVQDPNIINFCPGPLFLCSFIACNANSSCTRYKRWYSHMEQWTDTESEKKIQPCLARCHRLHYII